MRITREELFVLASNFYLTEELPDDFADLSETKQNNLLEAKAWPQIGERNADKIRDLIECGADNIANFLALKGVM